MDEIDPNAAALLAEDPIDPEAAALLAEDGAAPTDVPAPTEKGLLQSFGEAAVKDAAAVGGGIWKSIFETKDFVFGEPAEADKSGLRRRVEATQRRLTEESPVYGLAGSISQFAAGMVGLGKVLKAGTALSVGGRILAPATWAPAAKLATEAAKTTTLAAESAKAATVGAVAFDPWEERLSNLVEQYPTLSNPLTRYLAADPNDSATEGRLKSVIESLGMDAALVGVFKAVKLLRAGDTKGATQALDAVPSQAEEVVQAPPPKPVNVQDYMTSEGAKGAAPGQDNIPKVDLGTPANDSPPSRPAVAQGNLALADEPPTAQPPANDPRVSDVGVRTGDAAVQPPEPANVNMFNDDLAPRDVGPANDNKGFEQLFLEATTPKTEGVIDPRAGEPKPTPASEVASPTAGSEGPVLQRLQSPTSGGKAATPPKVLAVGEETSEDLLKAVTKDAEALETYGSREAAEEAGHTFAQGGSIPWQKLNTPEDLSTFLARAAKAMEPQLDAAKGGAVLSDARLNRLVDQRVTAYGDNPQDVLALFEKSGIGARTLAANMEAADAVAVKLADEAYEVALKIKEGRLEDWGGDRAAAMAEFAKRTGLAMTTFGHARSMLSNAARTLRRGRGDLERLSFKEIQQLKDMDPETLLGIIQGTKGDAQAIRDVLSKPGIVAKARDAATYLLVNNLLWGWKTHVVNLTTSGYMLAARPGEKIVGSLFMKGAAGSAVRRQALYEYKAFTATLADSFQAAMDAWKINDSVMDPHQVEAFASSHAGAEALPFRPVNNILDYGYNAISAVWQGLGFPTRALGAVDEMVKQIRYRSVVLADAQVEADGLGLVGGARTKFVEGRLNAAFDANGGATNMRALQEARVTTFQQELLPGTFGRSVQGFVANHPTLRFVLPFVKTPTNVLRYGITYSPGLNLLQSDFKAALSGKKGAEAQAQAAGQMSLGLLAVATAATLVADGRFTGTGPKDPRTRSQLLATGWQPNSIVWRNDDGTATYIPLGRFDPVGLPFGIIADLMDILQHPEKTEDVEMPAVALALAVAQQVTDRTYLQNLNQFIQALSDPGKNGGKFANNLAGNMVPAASGLKAYVSNDPYMREVRNMVDGMMSRVPGLSESLPAKYDAYGDPVTVRKNLASTVEDDVVDQEMIRMAMEFGRGVVVPPSPHRGDVGDLRDIVLEDGKTAYEKLQVYAGHPHGAPSLKSSLARIIQTDAYAKAPDGDSATDGTKQWILAGIVNKYHQSAQKRLLAESEIYRAASLEKTMKAAAAYTASQSPSDAQSQGGGLLQQLNDLAGTYGLRLGQ